jgi:replicative DNA helicase
MFNSRYQNQQQQQQNQQYGKQLKAINPEALLGKRLPSHIEAERSVLGAILLSGQTFGVINNIISAADFYNPAHQAIYDALVCVEAKYKTIDLLIVQDELVKRNALETIGGLAYLIGLQEDITSVGLAEQHARLVKEKSILRQLISSATDIITNCYSQNEEDINSVLDFAESTIYQIANKRASSSFEQLTIWLKKTFVELSEIRSMRKGITGIRCGFPSLDHMTSGFQKGDLIVLAARPSMGKTALALNIALNASVSGHSVGLFSLEMSGEQLSMRLLSTSSGLAHHRIRNASLANLEWELLTNTAADLSNSKLFIEDTAMLNVMDLRTKARKLKAEKGMDFIVIDYLQLLTSPRRHENRHQEVSEISRSLKSLAKELEVPVLALSQLSRAVDSRIDKRPMLSDLRESGAIEQDADVIMFLYRDIVYNKETENPASAELIIGKQRNGPTGTINLTFMRELTKFVDENPVSFYDNEHSSY